MLICSGLIAWGLASDLFSSSAMENYDGRLKIETMSASERIISFSRAALFNRRANRLGWVSRWFQVLVIIGFVFSFFGAIGGGYIHVLPSLSRPFFQRQGLFNHEETQWCDVLNGSWVQVHFSAYPLYNASECPFVEKGFNCLANGRSDDDYLHWRWKPKNCNVQLFDVRSILEMFRSKRIVFVGDSMSRTQWESLICMLMAGVDDKKSVYEVNQNKITKRIRFLGVRFNSFNFTVEFFRSVFLVQQGPGPEHAPGMVKSTLKLDMIDDISDQWIDSDVLIFNTGHWWVPSKLFETGCYFQVGSSLKLGMSIPAAFRLALDTWSSWVDRNINKSRTRVFFRTFEPSHWSDETRRTCNVTQYPTFETNGKDKSLFSDIVFEVVKNVTVPINVLHVTFMSASRSDAHVGNWSDNPLFPDCSHWCLPGVPDMWNEIVLSQLLTHNQLISKPN